jgi:glycosyltransferase involved in cell wall biosynthesis
MGKNKNKNKNKAKKNSKVDEEINSLINDAIESNKNIKQASQIIEQNKSKIKLNKKFIGYPNVSICTPTFNRRPFFKGLIDCVRAQDYPDYKMEWVIVDDGTDSVKDIFEDKTFIESMGNMKIRYFYEPEKMDLGKKRNYMHDKCEFKNDDDIIVYMDDDDYYPPERVSHSVQRLVNNPKALCGGSSEIYLWFNTLDKMYKFGPYGPNHATAGTFAFRRKLLKDTSYENEAVLAEEKHFLKNYTVPFVQFDPLKTILVFSHEQNTFDKRRLINDQNKFCKLSELSVDCFIKNKKIENFYKVEIGELLKYYEPGDVKNKPKVLQEIERRDKARIDMTQNRPSGIFVTDSNTKESKQLSVKQVGELLEFKQRENNGLKQKLQEIIGENIILKKTMEQMKKDIEELKSKRETNISELD